MPIINAKAKFASRRAFSMPVVKVPKRVRQALNLERLYENGIGKVEPLKKGCLYDCVYRMEDVNYINMDNVQKERLLNQYMEWFKTLKMDFKLTVANEYQSRKEFLEKVHGDRHAEEYSLLDEGIESWKSEKLTGSNPNVSTTRYLTLSCRADSAQEAVVIFNGIDLLIDAACRHWNCKVKMLNGEERLQVLHSLIRVGHKEEEELLTEETLKTGKWKNDLLPKKMKQHSDWMQWDDTCFSVLFGWKYRQSLDADTFLHSFSNVNFPCFATMDYAPVNAELIDDWLMAASMNNESAIVKEEDRKRSAQRYSVGPSFARQRKKEDLEGYADQVSENDEVGFFMNLLFVVTAKDEEKLEERVKQIQTIGIKEGVTIETADFHQLKGMNTALPVAGRQVDYMRFFLASSVVAFQPFHAQDIIEPGGIMYGLNRTTKRLIIGNRKALMNPHGIIVGHTGSGKSVLIKLQEIIQTMIATDDDIIALDPQNELMELIRHCKGSYFDLTPKSGIYLNGFEVPPDVFEAGKTEKERFIADQQTYAKSLCAAIMSNISVTQEHFTVISRATRNMMDEAFSKKVLKKQPTLKWLREELKKELDATDNAYDEQIIRPIYNSLEEYTEGGCDMLSRPTNIDMRHRLVGFGMKNVPEENWEAVMITVMHYISSRMEYNQKYRKATHLIVDETQVISRRGTSAGMLSNAVATFRKYGGVCTMAMQNLTAALQNQELKELFSNCSYKCFLDQGGVDANALAEIQELSQKEFDALSTDEVGNGVMVWGKKVVLFDAKISRENVLYPLITTNFHEEK